MPRSLPLSDIWISGYYLRPLQASVRCLANRGRLLEIGKYDILKGTPLSMRPLLRNIAFDGIDLDRVFNDDEDLTEVLSLLLTVPVPGPR